MVDEVNVGNAISLGIAMVTHWDKRPVVQVNQAFVAVIGREVESVKKICAKDGLSDVGNDEGEVEGSVCYANLAVGEAIAEDVRPIGRL